MEEYLPEILKRLESPFLESIEIKFRLECEADAERVNWNPLERVLLGLHFFGLKSVQVTGESHVGYPLGDEQVERWMDGGMSDLRERGVLSVRVDNEKVETLRMEGGQFNQSFSFVHVRFIPYLYSHPGEGLNALTRISDTTVIY
jgi:hypothetical protein